MTSVYKICLAALWREAEAAGAFAGAPVDRADGFVHLSSAAQVAGTAERHFAGQDDLLLVEIDSASLGAALRYEPSRGGELFPHLYGPLPISAVRRVTPLRLGADGRHVLPGLEGAPGPRSEAFDPARHGWRQGPERGLAALVGPIWWREDDPTRYGFVAEARHLNPNGVLHGGMLMLFADEAAGRAAWLGNERRAQVTIQLDTHFVDGVRTGEFVEAECRVVRRTRSLLFMAATLRVGDRVVSTSNGVWKVLGA